MIENPQPAWLPLLLLAVPGIAFAAYALNNVIFSEDRPLCTIPAIGMVLALLPTHVVALASGSLSIGLITAWSVIGTAGYVWILRYWREVHFAILIEHAGFQRKLGIIAFAIIPVILTTLLFNFSDEIIPNGHLAMIAHLQNGTYPPRYLYEPTLPLRYHYAFDLAAAIITGLLRIRVDQAIDLLTLTLWPLMFLLLWRVGEQVGGKGAGLFVAVAVSYSAGWSSLYCVFCNAFIPFYFQHPWGIAVPVFCLAVLQHATPLQVKNRPLRLAALACTLVLLSLSEIVLFATTIAALGIAEIWNFVRYRERSAVAVLVVLGTAAIGAKLIGGFLVSAPYPSAGGLFGTPFTLRDYLSLDALGGQARENLRLYGLIAVPGTIGLFRARREKLLLISLAIIGFVVYNIMQYEYTWDIIKFATLSSIPLDIGVGLFVFGLARWADNTLRKLISGALIFALLCKAVFFHFAATALYDPELRSPFQMIRPYFSRAYPADADDVSAVNYLRTHMGPSEIVYRAKEKSLPYAIWGGLPTQSSVLNADERRDNDPYGLGTQKFAAREDLDRITQDWFDRLAAQQVTWLVTDADDLGINATLASAEGRCRAVLAAQYDNLQVFRLKSCGAAGWRQPED
jgi:hypothetical protein